MKVILDLRLQSLKIVRYLGKDGRLEAIFGEEPVISKIAWEEPVTHGRLREELIIS